MIPKIKGSNYTEPGTQDLTVFNMKVHFFVKFLVIQCFMRASLAQNEGQVRLTGMNLTSTGRLEVFLNGKWGTVSRQLKDGSSDLHLAYGKTVCYQINHYNGDDGNIFTGTVASLNNYLENRPGYLQIKPTGMLSHAMYDLHCDHKPGKYPRHILRCSYKSPDSTRDHNNDLAVMCPENASNYDYPYNGQFRLQNSDSDTSWGLLQVYTNNTWWFVNISDISIFACDACNVICQQMGYTSSNDIGKNAYNFRQASSIFFSSITCPDDDNQCLYKCLPKSDTMNLINNSFTPHYGYYTTIFISCTFDVLFKDIRTSPCIGNVCEVCSYTSNNDNHSKVLIIVLVSLVLVIIIAIASSVILCCCFNKNCFIYQQIHRAKYSSI